MAVCECLRTQVSRPDVLGIVIHPSKQVLPAPPCGVLEPRSTYAFMSNQFVLLPRLLSI